MSYGEVTDKKKQKLKCNSNNGEKLGTQSSM